VTYRQDAIFPLTDWRTSVNHVLDFTELHSTWSAARNPDFESRTQRHVAGRWRLTFAIRGDKFVSSTKTDQSNGCAMTAVMTGDEQQAAIGSNNHSRKATVDTTRCRVCRKQA